MLKHTHAKQERIVEAVRENLEGDTAVEFVRQSGFAMTSAGIARHLRKMGGRGHIMELIGAGNSNVEILELCFPDEDLHELHVAPPSQAELFEGPDTSLATTPSAGKALYETRKMSIKIPVDLYEAIRFAAKAERKNQNDLIVEILTSALSRMPGPIGDHPEDAPPR